MFAKDSFYKTKLVFIWQWHTDFLLIQDTKREAAPEGEAAGCWRPTRRSPTKTVNVPPKAGQAKPKKPIIKVG